MQYPFDLVKPLASDSIFLDSYWSEVWQSITLDNKFRFWTIAYPAPTSSSPGPLGEGEKKSQDSANAQTANKSESHMTICLSLHKACKGVLDEYLLPLAIQEEVDVLEPALVQQMKCGLVAIGDAVRFMSISAQCDRNVSFTHFF